MGRISKYHLRGEKGKVRLSSTYFESGEGAKGVLIEAVWGNESIRQGNLQQLGDVDIYFRKLGHERGPRMFAE